MSLVPMAALIFDCFGLSLFLFVCSGSKLEANPFLRNLNCPAPHQQQHICSQLCSLGALALRSIARDRDPELVCESLGHAIL